MSITGGFPTDMDRFYRKSTHRRNDSDELDVFEARRYFDGGHEGAIYSQKISMMRDVAERPSWGGRRMSLDVPDSFSSQSHRVVVDKQVIKEKKYKQPRSPGGRLASFLNSLFHQTASKKKKSKSNASQPLKDEDESPGGRRKRRSSISHFQSSSSSEMKSLYSSSGNSGFRTPPPYNVNTPTKCYRDIATTYSDKKRMNIVPSSRCTTGQVDGLVTEKRKMDLARLDEKFKFIDVVSGNTNKVSSESNGTMFSDLKEMDEGADSDSSSDLFELQNYDLGVYSSGLPVYETTRIESIKRS
ncbi:hypothetical protein Syun_022770 [Stephania yunnanensis]|uniref:Protein BIG GRAIN 1-like E n=1 Tax=Stephania yunnanensis TaxID=152371 RepID=A0AAP0F8B1_9MAGN